MLSKCANPACVTTFQYLRRGRLFKFELESLERESPTLVGSNSPGHKKPVRRVEHFWLCGECARHMTLALECERKVVVVPLRRRQSYRAAAS
jgi:hypothetical protein